MTNLSKYIENEGPMLSGELAEYLVQTDKISNAAARKRIERLSSPIHKLSGYFSEKQSFIYHQNIYNSNVYFENLAEAFKKSGKRYFSILKAIEYHHGIISKNELANYVFSPKKGIKGHVLYSSIINNLIKVGVLIDYDDDHYRLNGYLTLTEPNFRHYKAIEFSKNLLKHQFNNWARNIGIISFSKGEPNEVVSGFQFALTGPSYIAGLTQYNNSTPKPGFLVADILIGNNTTLDEVDFFVQKINIIKATNPSIRLFPVLIIDGIDVQALNKLKQIGVLIGNIEEIFGENYRNLLKTLINTITNAGAILKKDPDGYINLMLQLTKLVDGKTNNLRGDLFELAVGYYYGQKSKFIEIGKRVRIETDYKSFEIDVFAVNDDEITIVECKGYNYAIDAEFIQKYLSEKIPYLKKWLDKSTFTQTNYTFEIWATGGYTKDAIELLQKAKINTKKYKIDYLDKEAILEKAKSLRSKKFMAVLKEYYFKDL